MPAIARVSARASTCPATGEDVEVRDDRILSPPIAFDLYTGTVAPESGPIVDAVARRLVLCPAVQLEIQVHTDAMRLASFNARASQQVADAIRDRLVALGVARERVAACGYGESQPTSSAPGWRAQPVNARVEWVRLTVPATAFVCPTLPP